MYGCPSDKTVHWKIISHDYLHVEHVAVLVTKPSIEILLHVTIYMRNICLS